MNKTSLTDLFMDLSVAPLATFPFRNPKVKGKHTSSLLAIERSVSSPAPLAGDTWLMAAVPGPLNNGRLTHNHLRQEEDSL